MFFVMVLTLAMLAGFVQITPVAATEPSDMQLVYDFETQTLSVNVSHYVANTKTHYIETIEIQKNGVFAQNRSYVNQSFNYGMYDTFSVSAVVDDNLTVTAICSKGYSLTRWLIVTSTTATNTPPPTDTTTTTTEPTNGIDSPGTPLGGEIAIVAGIGVVVFLIIFFAWLNPDKVPGAFKQLGSRISGGFSWFGDKLRGALSWLKVGLGNLLQQIKAKSSSK